MSGEDPVRRSLRELGVEAERIEIDPAYGDTAAFCEKYGYPLETSANAIIVMSSKPKGKACACLVLATHRLDVNKKVCGLLVVKKASFAKAEEMRALTGMEVGGVTPLGLPAGLPLFVDPPVMARAWVIVGAGSRAAKYKLAPEQLRKIPGFREEPVSA